MQTQEVDRKRAYRSSVYHNSCSAMGTRLNVVVTDTISFADDLFGQIVDRIRRIESKLSRFDESSDIYAINQSAGRGSVAIDSDMCHILALCIDYYHRTDGLFDVTLPSRANTGKETVPRGQSCLPEYLSVDSVNQTVHFSDPSIQIDLGGFGKGYALRDVRSILRNRGVHNALVSFGESSILAMGRHPYGDCWKIGVKHVNQPGTSACVFELKDQSLSVSGFQQSSEGVAGFHIINPETLCLVEKNTTTVVQSADPLAAEVLSTAVYAGLDTSAVFLRNFSDCSVTRVDYTNNQLSEIYTYE